MSRSAADATRFTATGPYVSPKTPYKLPGADKSKTNNNQQQQQPQQQPEQRPQSSSTSSSSGASETPRQKVERLRAQARAARLSQSTSTVDRFIERGRRVANGAHKVIIYTLIAASGVCGALTLYSAVSLTMWNRRQRELWLDRQLQELQVAREAYVKGTATPEQVELLQNEKMGEMERKMKDEAKEQRLWNRAKRLLFEGMKKEDTPEAALSAARAEGGSKMGVIEALNAKKAEENAAAAATAASTTLAQQTAQPGPLDVLAANAETTAKQSARGWSSWIWGR